LGRDYHKVLRNRLAKLADRIRAEVSGYEGRVFTDSAPVMEVELARKAGLGWRGKHTLLLSREHGSWFFLGEIYLNLPLPVDAPQQEHCGSCSRCIDICPTQAIIEPYRLDARRCISYITIELKGSIPVELRPLIGNRIYGCDDCQLVCPWNRFAQTTVEPDFAVRHRLDDVSLAELFAWDETEFKTKLAGSAIYRIGHEQWLRNIAVALGNAPKGAVAIAALKYRANHESALVREHVEWALLQHAVTNG
jgi:epoxyqueuosine reductase